MIWGYDPSIPGLQKSTIAKNSERSFWMGVPVRRIFRLAVSFWRASAVLHVEFFILCASSHI